MATRYIGLGTVFQVDKDDDGGYDSISLIVNAKPPPSEFEEIDDTTIDATFQTMSAGIKKHSQYSFRLKRDGADAVHLALRTLHEAKTKTNFKITWVDTKVWTFEGWIQKIEPAVVDHKSHVEDEYTVDLTSVITVT